MREANALWRDLIARPLRLRAESITESERSVAAVLTTQTPTLVLDLSNWRIVEEVLIVAGMESAAQVVMLDSHQRSSVENVRGSVREIRPIGNRVLGRLYFAEDQSSESAWQKVRQGHLTDVSVGYLELEYTDIAPGESETIDGKRYTARDRTLRVTTRWELREVSLVPIGADRAAKLRDDGSIAVNKRLRTYLESIGLRADASDESARDFLALLEGEQKVRALALEQEGPDDAASATDGAGTLEIETARSAASEQPARPGGNGTTAASLGVAPPPVADGERAADERTLVLGERDRIREILRLGELSGSPAELQQRAMFEGWDAARTARTFLERMRERSEPVHAGNGPAVHVRNHDADCTAAALAAGMMMRCSLPPVDPAAPAERRQEQERAADMGYRYRDMSMLDVCREAVRMDGGRLPNTRGEQIRAAVSGGALTNIFTTVVNAQLMLAYTQAADSTIGWVRDTDVPDFKSNERILLGQSTSLEKMARGGTAEHADRGDVKEEYKIARYARKFVIDEQDIIDDRLGALRDLPEQFGAAARRLRPDLVYAILLANVALGADAVLLFDAATHANYATSGSALAAATLEAGIAAMAKQTQDGINLNVEARFLIVPQDLRFAALVLLKSAQRIIASASGGTYNPIGDLEIELRTDNRIGAAGVTDPATGTTYTGSATNWFLAALPTAAPTIEVGYLAGTGRGPTLRSYVLDRGQYGIGWDVKLDIGAKALDYRGLYKATGAS